jgi:uncharacterized membrane protein
LAYRAKGKASRVSSIAGTLQQLFTIVFAVIILNERLDLASCFGIVLAILGAFLLSFDQKEKVL